MGTLSLRKVAPAAFGIGAAVLLAGCSDAVERGADIFGPEMAPPPATAMLLASVDPVVIPDHQSGNAVFECAAVGSYMYAYKIEPVTAGTRNVSFPDGHSNAITLSNVIGGRYFDWSASPNPIGAVIVKGGPAANVYLYDPAASSDAGLQAPINPNNDQPYGLSHVTFCWNPAFEELDVEKTAATRFKRVHDWSVDKSVDPSSFTLTMDGAGDGTATWTVDVAYEGYTDSQWSVYGDITIENAGTLDAVITGVEDLLGGNPIAVDCPVDFPYTLPVGETLTCSYDAAASGSETGNTAVVTTERDEYTGSATVTWGAPTTELNATVSAQDLSDLFGHVTLGTLTAPNGGQFTYTKDFAWEDYGFEKCGRYTYDNIAKVIGSGGAILDTDDASVAVYVPCPVFKGETAWAANGNTAGQLRYNARGNWATYVQYAAKTTTLFAGQTIPVGSVTFSPVVSGQVTITVTLTAPWEFENAAENLVVQGYSSAPSGNPAPGRFDHKRNCDASLGTCSITVPASNFYGVHVNVGRWVYLP